jgi:large subunit ribosomal protein L21
MPKDFAVIATGGKQYRVSAGDTLAVEKIKVKENGEVAFPEVLLKSIDGTVTIGTPHISGSVVQATLIRDFKDKTKIVMKYHSKTRQHKKKGHRQPHTEVKITKI